MSEILSFDYDLVCDLDEIGIIEKGGDSEEMLMYGWASTPAKDADSERIVQEGLDLSDVVSKGWINWNHESHKIIGTPTLAEVRDRENFGKGLWVEFQLLKALPLAKDIWDLAKALRDTPRRLGLSLEGKRKKVGKGGRILKAKVHNIAVCPNPKNAETTVDALVKAIVTGDENAAERFAPIMTHHSEVADRVESIVAKALTKALDSGHDIGGTAQKGGAAVRKESVEMVPAELVEFTQKGRARISKVDNQDLRRLGNSLADVADKRGGRLTKAEAALFTFLVSDYRLPECFKVYGLL